jgi:hypothetical protein
MAETPLAQLEFAVATNCTVVATTLLLAGALTDTPAKAGVTVAKNNTIPDHFMVNRPSRRMVENQAKNPGFVAVW